MAAWVLERKNKWRLGAQVIRMKRVLGGSCYCWVAELSDGKEMRGKGAGQADLEDLKSLVEARVSIDKGNV